MKYVTPLLGTITLATAMSVTACAVDATENDAELDQISQALTEYEPPLEHVVFKVEGKFARKVPGTNYLRVDDNTDERSYFNLEPRSDGKYEAYQMDGDIKRWVWVDPHGKLRIRGSKKLLWRKAMFHFESDGDVWLEAAVTHQKKYPAVDGTRIDLQWKFSPARFTPGSNLPPIELNSDKVVEVAAGHGHSCARLNDGSVKCWGLNDDGQLGQGNNENTGDEEGEMADLKPVNLGVDGNGNALTAQSLSAGFYHTCALLNDHSLKCWGWNLYGQLGQGNTENVGDEEGEMADLKPVNFGVDEEGNTLTAQSVAAGEYHTCAVLSDDSVKCWGWNELGQLGQGNTVAIGDDPDEIADLQPVNLGVDEEGNALTARSVSATRHTCAVLSDNSVKCWGWNGLGELGQGNTVAIGDDPDEIADLQPVNLGVDGEGNALTAQSVAAGSVHTCALLNDDSVKCWGSNLSGELGQGNTEKIGDEEGEMAGLQPVNLGVDGEGNALTAQSVATNTESTCALLNDDSVKCWGGNNVGQLGQGNTETIGDEEGEMAHLGPVTFGDCGTVSMVSMGSWHACAVLSDDSLKCWGQNNVGQLGQGNTVHIGDDPEELPF